MTASLFDGGRSWADAALVLERALVDLAVARAVPLYELSGLPAEAAANAEPLHRAARRAIWRLKAELAAGDRVRDHEGRESVSSILEAFLADLRVSYGETVASRVLDWLVRHELDARQRTRWAAWEAALLSARWPDAFTGHPAVDASIAERLRAVAEGRFGPMGWAPVDCASAAARAIELTADELDILRLEVSQPGDIEHIDVLEGMENRVGAEIAHNAVRELRASMGADEWHDLLRWASDKARPRGWTDVDLDIV